MVRIGVWENATALILFDGQMVVREMLIACGCGARRTFRSVPLGTPVHARASHV